MAGRAAAFALQIDRELAETEEEIETVVASIAMQAVQRIVLKTPVDTGRARGNWFVTIGGMTQETTQAADPSGADAISRGTQVAQSYESGGTWPSIIIQNNLPYIERLENGYSQQAASGMIAVTVAELEAQLR